MICTIIGANGHIGSKLADVLIARKHSANLVTRRPGKDIKPFDLRSPDAHLPDADVTFLCAAMAKFIDCESNPESWRVNVDAPIAIAKRVPYMVHLSSDAVERALHTAYGMQKAFAEMALTAMPNVLIARLPRVTSDNIGTICERMVELAERGASGTVRL